MLYTQYIEFKKMLFAEAVKTTNIPIENVIKFYDFLTFLGLIDTQQVKNFIETGKELIDYE